MGNIKSLDDIDSITLPNGFGEMMWLYADFAGNLYFSMQPNKKPSQRNKKKEVITDLLFGWATEIRTQNNRTKICCVTVTP